MTATGDGLGNSQHSFRFPRSDRRRATAVGADRGPGRQHLPRQADPHRGAVFARRRHGPDRPGNGRGHGPGPRPGRGDRQPSRRRHHHRHGQCGEKRARWLHAGHGDLRSCGESEPPAQAAVCHRQGLRAGDAGRPLAQCAGGAQGQPVQDRAGRDCRRQGQTGADLVRLAGAGHVGASGRRAVQAAGPRRPPSATCWKGASCAPSA